MQSVLEEIFLDRSILGNNLFKLFNRGIFQRQVVIYSLNKCSVNHLKSQEIMDHSKRGFR